MDAVWPIHPIEERLVPQVTNLTSSITTSVQKQRRENEMIQATEKRFT